MKRIVKTILLVAMIAILPTLSQAQTEYKQWMELAEQGYITKEEAATAIDKLEMERMENTRLAMEQNHEKNMRQAEIMADEELYRAMIPIVATIAITSAIVLVSMLAFRSQRRKDEQEKEMLNKLIDKGVFTQGEKVNLELFNTQKSITTAKNYITDATMIGVGLAPVISAKGLADVILIAANILLWVGILRLAVRTTIAIAKFIKETKYNNKVKNSFTETTAVPTDTEGIK